MTSAPCPASCKPVTACPTASARSALRISITGIAIALLGRNNPIGIIFAALIWGVLARGETALQIETEMPREFVIILQGLLILTVVITYELAKRRLARRQVRTAAAEEAIVTVETAPEEVVA